MTTHRLPALVSATLLALAHGHAADLAAQRFTPPQAPTGPVATGRLASDRSVVLAPLGSSTFAVFLAGPAGGGSPTPAGSFEVYPTYHDPLADEYQQDLRVQVVADVDGDGADDYAVIDRWLFDDGYLSIHYDQPYIFLSDPATGGIRDADGVTSGIQPLAILEAASNAYSSVEMKVLTADLDGENGSDLVAWHGSEIKLYLDQGGGTFGASFTTFSPNTIFQAVIPHPAPRSEYDVVLFVGDGMGVYSISGTNPEGWWFDYNYLSPIDDGVGLVVGLSAGRLDDAAGSADLAVVRSDTEVWYRLVYDALSNPLTHSYGDVQYGAGPGYSRGHLRIVDDVDGDGRDDLVELVQESNYSGDGMPLTARIVGSLAGDRGDPQTLVDHGASVSNLVFDPDSATAESLAWSAVLLGPLPFDAGPSTALVYRDGGDHLWFPGPLLTVNQPPVIHGGQGSVYLVGTEDQAVSVSIPAVDPDGDSTSITWSDTDPRAPMAGATSNGSFTVVADPERPGHGLVTYTPNADVYGGSLTGEPYPLESFSIYASDSAGATASFTINVVIQPVNDLPYVSSSPTTTGSAVGGRTLTAVAGSWYDAEDGSVTNLTYKWQRANDAAGSGAVDIATGASLVLGPSEVGKWVQVVETATDSASASSATGSGWAAVAAAPFAVSVRGATIANPYTAKVGETFEIKVVGGHPPYSAANSLAIASLGKVMVGLDLNGDSLGDLGGIGVFTPNAEGAGSVVVSDQDGNSASITFNATALPSVSVVAPTVAASTGSSTVYGVICPGTWQGVTSLKAALAGKARSEARAFAWDAAVQAYVELPTEPVGGLLPTHAVFLASRLSLPYDFNGWPAPIPFSIVLQPGWNFIGLPPLDDSGTSRRRHDFNADFLLKDEFGNTITGVSRTNLIGSAAKFWDGTAYQSVAVLDTGVGYWIQNASSPERPLVLERQAGGMAAPPAPAAAADRTYGYRSIGSPPSPPAGGGAATAEASGGGGCGGGLAALVMLGGLAFITRRLRGGKR